MKRDTYKSNKSTEMRSHLFLTCTALPPEEDPKPWLSLFPQSEYLLLCPGSRFLGSHTAGPRLNHRGFGLTNWRPKRIAHSPSSEAARWTPGVNWSWPASWQWRCGWIDYLFTFFFIYAHFFNRGLSDEASNTGMFPKCQASLWIPRWCKKGGGYFKSKIRGE